MAEISLDADSTTLILNGERYDDFLAGDAIILTPVNPHTSRINGSGGGVAIAGRTDSGVFDMTVNFLKQSNSDEAMQSIINGESITVLSGSVKEDYVRDGISGTSSYLLEGGSITTQPTDTRNNTDGNAASSYVIQFRNVRRNI